MFLFNLYMNKLYNKLMSLSYFVTIKGCYIWKRVQGIVWQCIRMISLFMEWKFSEDVFLGRDDFLKTLSLLTLVLVPCSFYAVYIVICPLMWNIANCNISRVCYSCKNMWAVLVSYEPNIIEYLFTFSNLMQKYLVIYLFGGRGGGPIYIVIKMNSVFFLVFPFGGTFSV